MSSGSKGIAIALTCFAGFGGFLYGFDTGNIGGIKAMEYWLNVFGTANPLYPGTPGAAPFLLSSSTDALVTSILSAGTFVGALAAYPAGDFLGRRHGIIAFLFLFSIGVALQTGGKTIATFAVGRVFAGLGVGGTSCLVPMYQAECAPKNIRGAIVAGYQWMITIGLLFAAVAVNGTQYLQSAACYQIPIGLQFIWAAILGVGLLFLPESPRWLLMKGKEDRALHSLSRLLSAPKDSPPVTEEFAEIAASLHHERSLGSSTYLDCFRNGPGRQGFRMWTGIFIQALQQLTGVNFIFYFGTQYFRSAGISDPFTTTIITSVVNVAMTVPGIYLVDKWGRRPLLLLGAASMCISQIIVAAVGISVSTSNQAGQKVLIAFVCIFIGSFAATWGCLAWVVTSEIYPQQIRGKAMSMTTASNWLLNFGIGYATPYLVNVEPGSAGLQSNVFWIWGGCCGLGFLFTYFMVAETMGLSLEQVDILYRNSSIIGSNSYRKKILAENIHDETTSAYAEPKPEIAHDETKRDLTSSDSA